MQNGYFVDTYLDNTRDAKFLSSLERRIYDQTEVRPRNFFRTVLDDEILFNKFRKKLSNLDQITDYFSKEHGANNERVEQLHKMIDKKVDRQQRPSSAKSHSMNGESSDEQPEYDSKLLIQNKALHAKDFALYKKAQLHKVSSLAEVLFAPQGESQDNDSELLDETEFWQHLTQDTDAERVAQRVHANFDFQAKQGSSMAFPKPDVKQVLKLVGPGRVPTPTRKFYRQVDESKLYTQKYVDMLVFDQEHDKLKILRLAKAMVKKVEGKAVEKAFKMVMKIYRDFVQQFDIEAQDMITQHKEFKQELTQKTMQVEELIGVVVNLERELSMMRHAQDYEEVKMGLASTKVIEGTEYQLTADCQIQQFVISKQRLAEECSVPFSASCYEFQQLSQNERCDMVTRNIEKFRDGVFDWTKDLDFTRKPFSFYGGFVRIAEEQKFKFAETSVVKYYISLVDELMRNKQAMDAQLSIVMDINQRLQSEIQSCHQQLRFIQNQNSGLEDAYILQLKDRDLLIAQLRQDIITEREFLARKHLQHVDMLRLELSLQESLLKIKTEECERLKGEIVPLKEIVTSSRRHFKNLTECNFEALKGQVLEYQAKLEKLGVSEQQLNRHRALMATNEMNSDQIELETQQLIEKGIRRGLKPEIDKAAIKYQVISRKMDEAMQRESSLETARDNLRNTQTNLSVMRTIDRWEENSRIFNTPKNSVFHGDSMRQTQLLPVLAGRKAGLSMRKGEVRSQSVNPSMHNFVGDIDKTMRKRPHMIVIESRTMLGSQISSKVSAIE